ncbi:hypothetical protein [Kaistella jeonii]|nr:hypothetical protein [Kaistella jeonii]
MKYFLLSMFMINSVLSCSSTKIISAQNQEFSRANFKPNAVYTEILENKDLTFYFFHDKEKHLYVATIKNTSRDSLDYLGRIEVPLTKYGRYTLKGDVIKIQRDIEKSVNYTSGRYTSSIMFLFIPMRFNKSRGAVTVVDKEIITEGLVEKDQIKIYKTYFGSKNYNFKKKNFIDPENLNSNLILNLKYGTTVVKAEPYDRYIITVIYK